MVIYERDWRNQGDPLRIRTKTKIISLFLSRIIHLFFVCVKPKSTQHTISIWTSKWEFNRLKMSLLKARYENFSHFMENNTRGVEVSRTRRNNARIDLEGVELRIGSKHAIVCFFLFSCLDWNIFCVWHIICGFLFKNPTGEYDFIVNWRWHSIRLFNIGMSHYSVLQITKFVKAQDIPKHFITKKIIQNGTIKSVEPNQVAGAILRIDHKPPINLFFASKKTLPVKVNGQNNQSPFLQVFSKLIGTCIFSCRFSASIWM